MIRISAACRPSRHFYCAQATFASAAEIKVFSTVGVKSVLEELVPKFEKASGHKLTITWSTAALLAKRVQAGEMADALILIKGNVETLLKDGKIAPGTDTLFAKSIFAVGVKAGAPKPDISTLRRAQESLLAAKAVSYSDPATGGASGVYIAKQIERMGITEQMKGKTKHPPSGGMSGTLLVSGEPTLHQFKRMPSMARAVVGSRRRGGRAAARRHGLHRDLRRPASAPAQRSPMRPKRW